MLSKPDIGDDVKEILASLKLDATKSGMETSLLADALKQRSIAKKLVNSMQK